VKRGVLVTPRGSKPVDLRANSGRLVDRELLGDGKVQRKMEEQIDVSAFRPPFAIEGALRGFEDGVILRVQGDQLGGHPFEAGQRLACQAFGPGIDEKASRLVAGGIEQRGAYADLSRNSHQSRIAHAPQRGDRATQTYRPWRMSQ